MARAAASAMGANAIHCRHIATAVPVANTATGPSMFFDTLLAICPVSLVPCHFLFVTLHLPLALASADMHDPEAKEPKLLPSWPACIGYEAAMTALTGDAI
jgi:hypothetical protein